VNEGHENSFLISFPKEADVPEVPEPPIEPSTDGVPRAGGGWGSEAAAGGGGWARACQTSGGRQKAREAASHGSRTSAPASPEWIACWLTPFGRLAADTCRRARRRSTHDRSGVAACPPPKTGVTTVRPINGRFI